MAPNFKVNDRVRVISASEAGFSKYSLGKTGTVAAIDDSLLPVLVYFDGPEPDSDWGQLYELELLADATAPKVAVSVKEKLAAIDKLVAEVRELLG